jgi:hypothetical protein
MMKRGDIGGQIDGPTDRLFRLWEDAIGCEKRREPAVVVNYIRLKFYRPAAFDHGFLNLALQSQYMGQFVVRCTRGIWKGYRRTEGYFRFVEIPLASAKLASTVMEANLVRPLCNRLTLASDCLL